MLRIELSSTELTTMIAHRRWLQLSLSSTDNIYIPLNLQHVPPWIVPQVQESNLFEFVQMFNGTSISRSQNGYGKPGSGLYYCTWNAYFFQRGVRVLCIALQASPIHNAAHPCSTNGLQRGRYQVLMPSRILGNACRDSAGPQCSHITPSLRNHRSFLKTSFKLAEPE